MSSRAFGSWVRAQRRARNWSQHRLARDLDMQYQTVWRWEAGRSLPRYSETYERLAGVFGLPVEAIPGAPPPPDRSAMPQDSWLELKLRERGMSGRQLARAIGSDEGSVSRWIRGKYRPGCSVCLRIAGALGLDPDEVLHGLGCISSELQPTTILAPRAHVPRQHPKVPFADFCQRCAVYTACLADLERELPAWCEYIDLNDVALAHGQGQLELLARRYDGRFNFEMVAEGVLK
jgi:transcriptional regulator with XRE-family HTH domain